MGLKLADDGENKKNESGLQLSGMSEQQRTDQKTEQENPWDFEKAEKPIVTHSISSSAITDSRSHGSFVNDIPAIVKVGGFVVYACILLMIGSMVWVALQPKIDIYITLTKFSPIISVCQVIIFIDAILVNVLYERKLSIILWAWLFCPVYPIKRDKHVNGGGSWGTLACGGMIIATVATVGNFTAAYMNYGQVIMNEDATVRNAIVEFMEQPVPNSGESFDSKLNKNFQIENMDYVTQGNKNIIVVQAYGQYDFTSDGIIDYTSNTVPTQLGFVKDSSGKYTIGAMVVNDSTLSAGNVEYYWTVLMK